MSDPATHTSRTIGLAQLGLGSLLLLSLVVLVALAMGITGPALAAVPSVVSTVAMCVAGVATGCGVGHAARHFGAKESSGRRK